NGDTLLLDAGAGYANYTWSTGANAQTIGADTAGVYWVDVVSFEGCSGTDTIQISSFSIPDPNLRTESGEAVICQNDSLVLLVDSVFNGYLWTTGSTGPTTQVTTGGNYTVQVTDSNGCQLFSTIAIQFISIPAPNPQILPSGTIDLCEGTTVDLDAGAGYFAYLWNTGQTNRMITVFQSGDYQVEVWNGFGCHSTSDTVTVVDQLAPVPTITQNLDTLFASTGASWQWYLNGNVIVGATSQNYVYTQNGNYSVDVTYANGCVSRSAEFSVIVAVDDPHLALTRVQIFPNPSRGIFHIESAVDVREKLNVRVVDLLGKMHVETRWRNLSGVRDLDLRSLPAGVYLLELQTRDGRAVHRLVVE
ncbi:MAG: T9SS type A sorting domain-containing protein, partial [Bacteroidota bacterium]